MYQVVIVGAGPAGAYLAYLLSREGISVLLLEKERLPRYKPCAGGLTPKVIKLLDFDLHPVIEDTVYTVILTHRLARPTTITFTRPIVYTVNRERFDSFLVDKAKGAGAEVLDGVRVEKIQMMDDKVSIYTDGMEWQGELLVGADGALSIVAQALGLARKKRTVLTIESHIPASTQRLEQNRGIIRADFGLIPAGYAWVFPKADHLSFGVGSMSPKNKNLRSLLEKFIQAEGLDGLSSPPRIQGWPIPTGLEPRDLHHGRALVVGDAAGLADPLTGEGIFPALYSAYLAAKVITEQIRQPGPDLQNYTDLVKEKLGPEIADAFRIAHRFYPASGLVHRLLCRKPEFAADDFVHLIGGDMTYAQFYRRCHRKLRPTWLIKPYRARLQPIPYRASDAAPGAPDIMPEV